ncbi:MAG: hypothetical protein MJ180_04680, partial [Candidatus Gastranaerophilales bacterium]|nr:hypothetical protein [Candidatus Gastranaerophilales bacterium]
MQILPIGRTNNNFSGRYLNIKQIQHDTTYTPEYDDHDYAIYSLINDNGKYEVTDDKGVQLAKERSHAEAIKKCGGYYFYNSSIEFNRWGDKGKVYFADPNEGITEDILRN